MPDTTKKIQVKIPVSVVPRAYVDYDAEARQILGFPLVIACPDRACSSCRLAERCGCRSGGLVLQPLTAARLIALELISSPFFLHPDSCDPADAARALVVLTADRADVAALTADPALLSARADALLEKFGAAIADRYAEIVAWVRIVPFYGFNMGPDSPPQHGEFWFDGAFVGSVVAPAARLMATTVDRVLKEIPLCLVGHTVVQYAASLGVKGIERKPDRAALKRIMAEAEARELAGQLHPWQYADPVCFPLTDAQAAANPALIELFAQIRAEYDRTHRPVDPADYPVPSAGEAGQTSAVEAPPAAADDSDPLRESYGLTLCVSATSATQYASSTVSVQGLPCCLSVEDAGTAFSTITVQAQPAARPALGQEITIHGF